MLWRDFEPYVMPFVPGCPLPVMEHHARLVAQDFCRRTLCFTRTLDPVSSIGTAQVEMDPLPQTQIVKIKAVAVDGLTVQLVDRARGAELARADNTGDFCFTADNLILELHPPRPAGASVVIDAALAPTLTATMLEREIAAQYAQDMAHGIVASIMRLPQQVFSDPANAMVQDSLYQARRATVAAKMARGQAGAKLRSHVTYL